MLVVMAVGVITIAMFSPFTDHFVMARTDITERLAPEISGDLWLNSEQQTIAQLRGKVVLVEFWTFGCYNCRNVEPHVKAWYQRYTPAGLRVIAVHTPEFAREKDADAVRAYARDHDLRYPIVLDNKFSTWERYGNEAWPAIYLVDKRGRIRLVQVGEGRYAETEQAIRDLLEES